MAAPNTSAKTPNVRKIATYKVPVGSAIDERVITAADVNRLVGTNTGKRKDLVWSAGNNFKLDITDERPEVLAYLTDDDADFEITEVVVDEE